MWKPAAVLGDTTKILNENTLKVKRKGEGQTSVKSNYSRLTVTQIPSKSHEFLIRSFFLHVFHKQTRTQTDAAISNSLAMRNVLSSDSVYGF